MWNAITGSPTAAIGSDPYTFTETGITIDENEKFYIGSGAISACDYFWTGAISSDPTVLTNWNLGACGSGNTPATLA